MLVLYDKSCTIFMYVFFCTFAGKNDGSVKGVRYFSCGAKRGVFVRADKVLLDKRGRSVRNNNPSTKQQENNAGVMRRSVSKGKVSAKVRHTKYYKH